MATVINNPSGTTEDSGMGLIVGVVIALLAIVIFFVYGLPAIRNSNPPAQQPATSINVQLPSGQSQTPAPSN